MLTRTIVVNTIFTPKIQYFIIVNLHINRVFLMKIKVTEHAAMEFKNPIQIYQQPSTSNTEPLTLSVLGRRRQILTYKDNP